MKKIILGICVLATIASCKKSSDDVTCEVSVAGITGNYKLTKVVVTLTGFPDQDVTTTLTDDCQRGGVYQLKADKSVVYTEAGGTCTDNGTGSWDVVNNKFSASSNGGSVDFTSLDVVGWDCGTLTVSQDNGSGSATKFSLTKQ
jgi:hypothetical protein